MSLPETGKKVEGLLGSDLFREVHAMIDYSAQKLWLHF